MAIISRPSIPEVIFERIKTDLTDFGFNFFQDGISLNVSTRTYKLRLKASGVNALDKASVTNEDGRVTFVISDADKANLKESEYQLFLVEILAGGGEKTLMAGTMRWSVPFGKPTGLVAAPDVSVNYITTTQELMVALGVVDFGSMSSATSAAQAVASATLAADKLDQVIGLKEDIDQAAAGVEQNKTTAQQAAALATQAKTEAETILANVDQALSGVGSASPTSAAPTNVNIVNVLEAGTYVNFGNIIVSSADLTSGLVQLRKVDGVWGKVIIEVPLANYISKAGDISVEKGAQLFTPDISKQNFSILSNTGQPNDGSIIAAAGQWWSGYIPVDPSKSNIAKTIIVGGTNSRFYFYDANHAFISKTNAGMSNAPIPPTAAYMAFIIASSADHWPDAYAIMVNYGTAALPLPTYLVNGIDDKPLAADQLLTENGYKTLSEYLAEKGYLLPSALTGYALSSALTAYLNKTTDVASTERTQLFKPDATKQNFSILSNTGQPNDGSILAATGQWWSGYIPVNPAKANIAKTIIAGGANSRFYFYDLNLAFISKTNSGLSTVPIPATAAYVAFIVASTADRWTDANAIMLNYGTVPLPYVEYDTDVLVDKLAGKKLVAAELTTELGRMSILQYLMGKGVIVTKPAATLFKPAKVYTICNDTRPVAQEYSYSTDLASSIYIDHMFNLNVGSEIDAYVKENGTDRYNFSGPKSVDGNGNPVYNNGVDISTIARSFTVAGDVADQAVAFNQVSTKASYLKAKAVRHLRIGDSTGYGTSTALIDVADGAPSKVSDFMLVYMERLRVDAGNPATEYVYKPLGTKYKRQIDFSYRGVTKTLQSYTESQGSWSACDYYLYTDRLTTSFNQGIWDRLGLGNGTGTDYTGSAAQKLTMLTTPEGKFAPVNTAAFISHMNAFYGGITTYAQAVTKQNDLLTNNPVNPFFDGSLTGDFRFSMTKYMQCFQTMDASLNRLIVGSTAGSKVTDNTAWDVCPPTHVTISLGTNDLSTHTAQYVAAMTGIISQIKAYDSNIIIMLAMIDMVGTYFPKRYPRYAGITLYDNYAGHSKAIAFNQQLMVLENAGNKIFYLPSFFIQPTAEGVAVKKTPRAKSLAGLNPETDQYYVEWGKNTSAHPSAAAYAEIGVSELSAIQFTKQYMP